MGNFCDGRIQTKAGVIVSSVKSTMCYIDPSVTLANTEAEVTVRKAIALTGRAEVDVILRSGHQVPY
jgi:hypothetical protein